MLGKSPEADDPRAGGNELSSILMDRPDAPATSRGRAAVAGVEKGWRAAGWFGLVLSIVGATDIVLIWYPWNAGTPAWEFAVVGQTFSALPLLTMGLAALLASAFALGSRVRLRAIATVLLLLGIALGGGFVIYLLSAAVVVGRAPPEVGPGLYKAVVKTSVFAVAFVGLYVAAGVAALRFASTRRG